MQVSIIVRETGDTMMLTGVTSFTELETVVEIVWHGITIELPLEGLTVVSSQITAFPDPEPEP